MAKSAQNYQQTWKQEHVSRGTQILEGHGPADTFISDPGPQNCETINFYCLKPPTRWYIVTLRHNYRAPLLDVYLSSSFFLSFSFFKQYCTSLGEH